MKSSNKKLVRATLVLCAIIIASTLFGLNTQHQFSVTQKAISQPQLRNKQEVQKEHTTGDTVSSLDAEQQQQQEPPLNAEVMTEIDSSSNSINSNSSSAFKVISSARFANGAANRSPPRSATPLRFSQSEDDDKRASSFSIKERDVKCWDPLNGHGVQPPAWTLLFFRKVLERGGKALYDELRNETARDRWSVLVGWTASKFMPPQPPGRRANGEPMDAPTKGRNPKFYSKEYNATWTLEGGTGQQDMNFQLAHRNILAVCIRERLHVLHMFCSPSISDGFRPMLLYYCPCRHCREPQLKGPPPTRIQLSELESPLREPDTPATLAPAKPPRSDDKDQSEKQHPKSSKLCVDALAAPWLVDRSLFPKFKYEGLHSSLDALLRVQADPATNVVMMSIFNKFWLDHLHNAVYSMAQRAQLRNFIVATMDDDALRLCISERLPCFDASEYAEAEDDMTVGGQGYKKGHLRKVTEAMSWIKPRLAVAVLKRGYHFLMFDLDISFNINPMRDMLGMGTDIVHQCDAPGKYSINSGWVLSRSNARTLRYHSNLMLLRPEENSDQTAMKLFARYDHTHGARNACLNKWAYNMKCNYKIDGSVQRSKGGGGGETFKWLPFDRDRKSFRWKMLHATCLAGAVPKLVYLRAVNAWFLDDLDNTTTRKKDGDDGYCISVPASASLEGKGLVLSNQRKTTRHSAKYTTAIDKTFLYERH